MHPGDICAGRFKLLEGVLCAHYTVARNRIALDERLQVRASDETKPGASASSTPSLRWTIQSTLFPVTRPLTDQPILNAVGPYIRDTQARSPLPRLERGDGEAHVF